MPVEELPAARPAGLPKFVVGLYFGVVTVVLASVARFNLLTRNAWSLGDWLINYQGGFVRRGLIGELALQAERHAHVAALPALTWLQVALYGLLLFRVWRLVNLSSWHLWIVAFALSPATLGFPVLDRVGGFRKEILLLTGLAVLLDLLRNGVRHRWIALYLAGATVLVGLSHEALLLYLPYWFAAVAMSTERPYQTARIVLPAGMLALACLVATATHAGKLSTAQRICDSFGGSATGLCDGAVAALGTTPSQAHDEVVQVIAAYRPVWAYVGLSTLALLPTIPAVLSLRRAAPNYGKLAALAGCCALSAALTGGLFVYTLDWGRWIYIHTFSLFLVLLFVDITTPQRLAGDCKRSTLTWQYALLFAYATMWSLPRKPGSLPLPTGYLERGFSLQLQRGGPFLKSH